MLHKIEAVSTEILRNIDFFRQFLSSLLRSNDVKPTRLVCSINVVYQSPLHGLCLRVFCCLGYTSVTGKSCTNDIIKLAWIECSLYFVIMAFLAWKPGNENVLRMMNSRLKSFRFQQLVCTSLKGMSSTSECFTLLYLSTLMCFLSIILD